MGDTITQAMASACITNITSNSYPNTAGTALVLPTTWHHQHPPHLKAPKEKNKSSRRRTVVGTCAATKARWHKATA
jgi:hypothetical protein